MVTFGGTIFWNTSWMFSVIITHNKTTIGQKTKVLGIIYYFCFDNFFGWALKFWLVLTWRPQGIIMESRSGGKSSREYFLTWLLFYFSGQAEVHAAQIILLAIYVEKYHSYICIANSSIWTWYLILPICEIALNGGMHSLIILISWLQRQYNLFLMANMTAPCTYPPSLPLLSPNWDWFKNAFLNSFSFTFSKFYFQLRVFWSFEPQNSLRKTCLSFLGFLEQDSARFWV